jgi:hypothetical protein
MTALSIRDRAIVAEQRRVANAKLALAPHDTEHEINIMVDSSTTTAPNRAIARRATCSSTGCTISSTARLRIR